MKRAYMILGVLLASATLITSCKKFSELNKDPNNITAADASPDYLMASILTGTATEYGNYGSGNMSGAMQQTYQDAFGNTYSGYNWSTVEWSGTYSRLRDNKLLMQKAETNDWKFHHGVALVMRAFNFGYIADFWGPAPDSMALKGDQDGSANQFPAYDSQESMYNGVIADLKAAIPYFDGTAADHTEITSVTQASDVFYQGDPTKWKKLAYSLLLRYYMRLSAKQNVQAGVEAVAANVFASNDDDFAMPFPGKDQNSSYQKASAFAGASNFNRNKMCATLVKKMDALKDPRIVIMAEPILTPSVVDASKFAPGDNTTLLNTIGGIRYINPAAAAASNFKEFDINTYATDRPWGVPIANVKSFFDTSPTYVGIPISYSPNDFAYNINGVGTQSTSNNAFVSYMRRSIYDNVSGDLLKQRLASYNEICFDLAEAALKGWNVGGTAEDWYNKGIQASFDMWEVFSTYQDDVNNYAGAVKNIGDYMAQPAVAYNGTLDQIIEQKWIASWQASCESFLDWRRTGLPNIQIGWNSYRQQIPLRFAYPSTESSANTANYNAAVAALLPTAYIGPDGNNSAWSKFWLLDGTSEPWQ